MDSHFTSKILLTLLMLNGSKVQGQNELYQRNGHGVVVTNEIDSMRAFFMAQREFAGPPSVTYSEYSDYSYNWRCLKDSAGWYVLNSREK